MRVIACICACALVALGCSGTGDNRGDAAVVGHTGDAGAADAARALDADSADPRDAGAIAVGHVDDAGNAYDASTDGGVRRHVCHVYDDCNGGQNNDYSASACPMWEPTVGDGCTLTENQYCYYCDPSVEARHWWEWIPRYSCNEAGVWRVDSVAYACE